MNLAIPMALAASLASNLDAGSPADAYGCKDAPAAVSLDGGWVLMPPERAERVACMLVGCQAQLALEQPSGTAQAIVASGAGIAAGFVLGLVVAKHH